MKSRRRPRIDPKQGMSGKSEDIQVTLDLGEVEDNQAAADLYSRMLRAVREERAEQEARKKGPKKESPSRSEATG